jgi:DNA-directed RNA polymerase subunit RPC12/RpoP
MENNSDDSEICEFCLQSYSYEMQYRCLYCESPVCPICVLHVWEKQKILCPDCNDMFLLKKKE